jgi:D-xylose transport system substrate-binding protein
MRSPSNNATGLGALALAATLLIAACSSGSDARTKGADPTSASSHIKIALLLPESKTTRYETKDKPLFEKHLKAICPSCEVLYGNADQSSAKQQQQAEAAITNGAKVLVLDPVDGAAAAVIVRRANAAGVKVLDHERLIPNAKVAWYVSYDNLSVGKLQAKALADQLKAAGKPGGTIVMINGSPTDNNAKLFKQGAHSVFDNTGLKIGAEYDTQDWSPDKAQQEMQQSITKLGKGSIDGVYAANDGTAGGAIAAMKQAGMSPLPPLTGQDAEVAAIQRVIAGEQFMTIYKAIEPEVKLAAEVAYALARGKPIPTGTTNRTVTNGAEQIPSQIFTPTVITVANVKTVFDDGFVTYAQICTSEYRTACQKAGITG